MTLEAACADPEDKLAAFQQACAPLERTLSTQPYICGPAPAYADDTVFSVFQWARLGSPKEVVAPGSAIAEWRRRMIALFGNLGDRFPAIRVMRNAASYLLLFRIGAESPRRRRLPGGATFGSGQSLQWRDQA